MADIKKSDTFINAAGVEVPTKYKGTKSYRSPLPYYKKGVYFQPGETITVTDSIPSKHWIDLDKPAPVTAPQADYGRVSDKNA